MPQAEPLQETMSAGQRIGTFLVCAAALAVFVLPGPETLAPAAQRLVAVTILMAGLWITQALPLAATALIPLVAFPLCGIQAANDVSKAYISSGIFLYLGGFILAMGIEHWGLHRRIALHIVRLLGQSPRRVVLGFMLATAFLSMWISNTAATLLMLPICVAMLAALGEAAAESRTIPTARDWRRFAVALTLGVAYSANIGGMLTLIGTPTNIAYQDSFRASFPEGPEISSGRWMATFVPMGIVFLLATWIVLTGRLPRSVLQTVIPPGFFTARLQELGKPRRGEWMMLIIVGTTILLWMTRSPFQIGDWVLTKGWGQYATLWLISLNVEPDVAERYLHDSTVAMTMVLLMFALPAARTPDGGVERLMTWERAVKLPWGILLLIGGGLAIAGAFSSTGLSEWVGAAASRDLNRLSPFWVIIATCTLLTFLTEFTTNVATANVVLPILAAVAVGIEVDPRMLMIPAVISTSCAFMLPIGTPPNAIVFSTGHVRMNDMISHGLILNFLGVVLVTLTTFLLLVPQLGIAPGLPEWAVPATVGKL